MNASVVLLVPLIFQGAAMAFDELHFHRKRGLGPWERIGHPIDTLTVVACLAWVLFLPPSRPAAIGYLVLAIVSCLLITKDEWVHARRCDGGEHWVHALLFLVHPVTLAMVGLVWPSLHAQTNAWIPWFAPDRFLFLVVTGQFALTSAFCIYQIAYWNLSWLRRAPFGR